MSRLAVDPLEGHARRAVPRLLRSALAASAVFLVTGVSGAPAAEPAPAPATPLSAPHELVHLPPSTGSFAVGTLSLDFDTGRPETFTPDPGDRRRLAVQLWYPAAPGAVCKPADYMDAGTSRAVADDLPADFATSIRHDGCLDAPPADAPPGRRWPVILFSHGLGATRFSYASLHEELASRGFVVVALHHPFASRWVPFADGSSIAWNEALLDEADGIPRLLDAGVADARSTLGFLDELDRRPGFPLARRWELGRVGYAGHSFGGALAIGAASGTNAERRIAAVANLDGRLWPGPPHPPAPLRLDVPLLVLLNEKSERAGDYATGPDLYLARIAGASHASFTDLPAIVRAFPAVAARQEAPSLSPEAGIELTRRAVEGFFACTLRGERERCDELRRTLELSPSRTSR